MSAVWVGALRRELEGQVTRSEGTGASACLALCTQGKGSSLGGGRPAGSRGGEQGGAGWVGLLGQEAWASQSPRRRLGWRRRKTWSQGLEGGGKAGGGRKGLSQGGVMQ